MTDGLEDTQRMVQDVLNDEYKYRKILEAKGDDAQMCLDLLQVLAERSIITTQLQSSVLKMMLRLSKRSGLCPKCLVVKNVKRLGGLPVGGGGFGDVYKGVIGERMVCLKLARIFEDSEDASVKKLIKGYMQEAIVWKQLKHPNLLPFIGMYYLEEGPNQLCLISPWMDRGDLTRYLRRTPPESVDHLLLAYDVAAGLSYLHSKEIVHGDLKGLNVLINADERACIGDFGLSRVVETHTPGPFTSTSTSGAKGTTRWLSPELLDPDSPCPTSVKSDIYAYACVCYEIFTGKQPFHKLRDGAVITAVLNHKKHPDRPEESREELSDPTWEVMVSCWQHDERLRPPAADVLSLIGELKSLKTGTAVRLQSAPDLGSSDRMEMWLNVKYPPIDTAVLDRLLRMDQVKVDGDVGEAPRVVQEEATRVAPTEDTKLDEHLPRMDAFFRDQQKCQKVSATSGEKGQRWLDLLQALLDHPLTPTHLRSIILKILLRLSKTARSYPKCLTIKNVAKLGKYPITGDTFGDTWKGVVAGQIVCLKISRVFLQSDVQQLDKEYMQEAIVWQQLRHPNLLPFVGLYHFEEGQGQPCLVSPWMEKGNLVAFLRGAPRAHIDHLSLASGVASGLAYLHHANIVHGGLKGSNIFITPDLRAAIGDFGSSRIALDLNNNDSDDIRSKGSVRWLAPELLDPKSSCDFTTKSDMYAYGCVCYEIFTGRVPFHNLRDGAFLVAVLIHHERPSRPIDADLELADVIWEFMDTFWNHDPNLRLAAADALDQIRHLASLRGIGDIQSTPDWKWFDTEKVRQENAEYPPLDLELLSQI